MTAACVASPWPRRRAVRAPQWSVLFERARVAPRPRALPPGREAFIASLRGERRVALAGLVSEVDARLREPLPREPALRDRPDVYWGEVHQAAMRTRNAAFAWLATGREQYGSDALPPGAGSAAWAPRGATSYASADVAARDVAWTLALAYDWLHARLDAEQKNQLLAALRVRVADMFDDVAGDGAGRLSVHPTTRTGNQTLLQLAAISVLLAGDLVQAQDWLRRALPLALQWTSPWGGEDGGFANGTAYAQWDSSTSLLPWRILRWVVGVDLGRKAWVRNHARFLAYFLPPGGPAGGFGDGAELQLAEERARVGKGIARFAPSPLARWMRRSWLGEGLESHRDAAVGAEADSGRISGRYTERRAVRLDRLGGDAQRTRGSTACLGVFQEQPLRLLQPQPCGPEQPRDQQRGRAAWPSIRATTTATGRRTGGAGTSKRRRTTPSPSTADRGRPCSRPTATSAAAPSRASTPRRPRCRRGRRDAGVRRQADPGRAHARVPAPQPRHRARCPRVARTAPMGMEHPRAAADADRRRSRHQDSKRRRDAVRRHAQRRGGRIRADGPFQPPPREPNVPDQWHGAFVSKARSTTAEFVAVLRAGCTTPAVSMRRTECGWIADTGRKQVAICRVVSASNRVARPRAACGRHSLALEAQPPFALQDG